MTNSLGCVKLIIVNIYVNKERILTSTIKVINMKKKKKKEIRIMFKEERKLLTEKGNEWDEETRLKFTKQDMEIFCNEKMEFNPTDMFVGHDKEGNVFYQLIDEKNNTYINVPSMDIEFFNNLESGDINELLTGKHKVIAKSHKSKKSGRTYYELIIE